MSFITTHGLHAQTNRIRTFSHYYFTQCFFIKGRMLKTGENQRVWTSLLEVATTWLCLLVHWPFHTAWLSLFLEEHYSCTQQRVPRGSGGGVSGEAAGGGAPTLEVDEDDATTSTISQPVLPDDTLSMLYSRVLERYGIFIQVPHYRLPLPSFLPNRKLQRAYVPPRLFHQHLANVDFLLRFNLLTPFCAFNLFHRYHLSCKCQRLVHALQVSS